MSNFALTIDAGFVNGATAPGTSMDPTHWTVPLGEVENLLQGRVGRDGVGIDNWTGDQALRGVNFREGGLADVFTRQIKDEPWSFLQSATTSHLPGGSLRFFLRDQADLFVTFQHHATASSRNFGALIEFGYSLDGAALTYIGEYNIPSNAEAEAHSSSSMVWSAATVASGWHGIEHRARSPLSPDAQLVIDRSDLVVVAVYR